MVNLLLSQIPHDVVVEAAVCALEKTRVEPWADEETKSNLIDRLTEWGVYTGFRDGDFVILANNEEPIDSPELVIVALTKREADLIADRFQEDGFKDGDDELEVALDKICNARAEYDDAPEYGQPIGQSTRPITLTMDEQEKQFILGLLLRRIDVDGPGSISNRLCDRLVGKETSG